MTAIKGRFWLGVLDSETLFETGWQVFDEEDFEINREGRVANGDLVIDTIATKKRWSLAYTAGMLDATLETLKGIYVTGTTTALSLLVERSDDTVDSYTVKLRPFKRTRELAMDQWFWRGVRFEIEEV